MRAAFRAAAERAAGPRFLATAFACRDSAVGLAALLPSRSSASDRRPRSPRRNAGGLALAGGVGQLRAAASLCRRLALGRRLERNARAAAFDKPMAIACFADRAPCLPSRTCSISSRTNSPACVLGVFPSRLSSAARCSVFRSGMIFSFASDRDRVKLTSGSNGCRATREAPPPRSRAAQPRLQAE